jgi:predicted GNAT family N-acyltransferase
VSSDWTKTVRVARPDELAAIGHFRYVSLLGDTGFRPSDAMRATEQLTDAWDQFSEVLIAGDASEILGTFRIVPLGRVVRALGYEAVLRTFAHLGLGRALSVFSIHEINVVGRLAVAPSMRGTRTVVDLLAAALHGCRSRGERLSIADCSPPLLKLYERLAGFFRSGADYRDAIYGLKTPMMGTLGDHQASARAAIGHVARAFPDDPAAREFRLRVMVPSQAEQASEKVRNVG